MRLGSLMRLAALIASQAALAQSLRLPNKTPVWPSHGRGTNNQAWAQRWTGEIVNVLTTGSRLSGGRSL